MVGEGYIQKIGGHDGSWWIEVYIYIYVKIKVGWNRRLGYFCSVAGCPFQVLILLTRRFAGSHQILNFCIPHVSGPLKRPIGFCNGYAHQIFEIPVVPGRGSFRGENTKKLKEDFAYRTHARRPGSGMPKANCCVVHQPSDVPSDGGVLLVVAGLYSM